MQKRRNNIRSNNGQSMVEAALAIPFMLMCIFAIAYFGKIVYVDQIMMSAAQESVRVAAFMPNLNDPTVRNAIRGFTTDGKEANPQSVVYAMFSAANLLSNGKTGDLPPGASVRILPWDATGDAGDVVQPGTVAVRIEYPFSLLKNPFTGQSTAPIEPAEIQVAYSLDPNEPPYRFPDFKLSEKATAAQQVYQEGN